MTPVICKEAQAHIGWSRTRLASIGNLGDPPYGDLNERELVAETGLGKIIRKVPALCRRKISKKASVQFVAQTEAIPACGFGHPDRDVC